MEEKILLLAIGSAIGWLVPELGNGAKRAAGNIAKRLGRWAWRGIRRRLHRHREPDAPMPCGYLIKVDRPEPYTDW